MPFSGKDETLVCSQCKQQFLFTVGEQKFFESKNFTDPPRRCKQCRDARKAQRMEAEGFGPAGYDAGNYADPNEGNRGRRRRY